MNQISDLTDNSRSTTIDYIKTGFESGTPYHSGTSQIKISGTIKESGNIECLPQSNTSMNSLSSALRVEQKAAKTKREEWLTNADLEPVKVENRTWSSMSFVNFWISDSININTLMLCQSNIALGLTWWMSLISVLVGYVITAVFIVASSRPGATYHLTFPVTIRQSWGIYGSLWPIINRVAIAILWFAVQTYIGGNCIRVMIRCWAPDWINAAGLQKDLDTNLKGVDMVSFILFWLLMLIPTWFPIQKIKHFFTFKAIVAPLGLIIFFGWSLGRANATPEQAAALRNVLTTPSSLSSEEQGWTMVRGIVSAISNAVTLILNISDLASRSRNKKDIVWPQLITVPIGFFITSFFGIIIASCYQAETGDLQAEWDPMVILDNFINPESASVRFAVWFIAFCLCVAQIGTNQAANVIACGCDLTACMPSYINNRRGGYICVFLGLALVPWRLTDGATSFTNYLSGYCVFLSAIAGTMLSDYYVVRRGRANIADLYKVDGWYRYTYGVNLRAVAAYLCGVAINLPGFIASTPGNESLVAIAATRIYNLSFFTGFLVSSVTYITLSYIFVPTGAVPFNAKFEEIDYSGYTHDTNSIYDLEINGVAGMADGAIAVTASKTDSSSVQKT